MIEGIIFILISIFILSQGASFYGYVSYNPFILEKFIDNDILELVRFVLLKWSLLAGVSCFIAGIAMIILYRANKRLNSPEKTPLGYYFLIVIFVLYALFTII